ncbi:THO complex subunit 5 [Halocaridina rubra]|uniref:THO complex subunit 5 n=1 Tax=Halocaridina rubra TaxID=373956 RepID=A0AAN9A3S2_HALRR
MVNGEESNEGTREAKKRRTESTETPSKPQSEELSMDSTEKNADSYQNCLDHECKEAEDRTEEQDQTSVASINKHIRTLMKQILDLKVKKPENYATDIEERRIQVMMLMLSLRRLSRVQKVRVRDARERTSEARQGVDGVTLQLQNLLYEVAHLKKEVRRCLDFQSADQEIDLVPLEQFYIEAPENISRPTETVENPHEQRLARLQWELEQRRDQTQLFDRLTQEKEEIAETINEHERKLASLAPRINAILEATRPLQESLGLRLDAKKEQQRIVQLLPCPLYTLWVQASAYGEAFDKDIKVEVLGDIEAAKKKNSKDEDLKGENLSDSDNDQEQQEDNLSRKKRARKVQKFETTEDADYGAKQILGMHPLYVKIAISTKEGNSVVIHFYYIRTLRIVTAKCAVHLQEKTKAALTDVISGDTLLNCLFPDDFGMTSPNPANFYQLSRSQVYLGEHLGMTGRPYKWAQTLAGLSFANSDLHNLEGEDSQDSGAVGSSGVNQHNDTDTIVWQDSAEHMPNTISAIRRRLQARLALHSQLLNLESANTTSTIALPAELLKQHFPGKVCTEMKSWRPMTWSDYEASPATQLLREGRHVTSHHMFFTALFERKHVRLEALFAVSPDHPICVPAVALCLHWDGRSIMPQITHS